MRSSTLFVAAISLTLAVQTMASAQSKWSLKNLLPGDKSAESARLPKPEGRTTFTKKKSGNAFTAPLKRIGDDTKRLFGKTKALVPSLSFPETQRKTK